MSFLRGQGLLSYVDGELLCPPAIIHAVTPFSDTASSATTSTTMPNLAHAAWIQQDQSILSLLISSLSDEVIYLDVGRNTSRDILLSITTTLDSSTCARCLNLLGQFQSLYQGNSSLVEYLGKAQLIVEGLALAGRPLSLDEQNLYVFKGLRLEFRSMAVSLTVSGTRITILQLLDFSQAQEFIFSNEFLTDTSAVVGGSPMAMFTSRGR